MAHIVADRVADTSSTTGTSAFALDNAEPTGYQNFDDACADADTIYYAAQHRTLDQWEVGLGTYNSGTNTLTRTTVLASSNSNSAVTFSAGIKDVLGVVPASILARLVTGVFTSSIAASGGIAAAGGFAISPRGLHTGNQTITQTSDGNDTTPSVTETYICEVYVPYNCTITGVALFNGSAVAGNVTVTLANSSGVPIGTQSASTAQSGTDAFQLIPLGATYAAVGPATYLVLVQFNNTGARFNTHIAGAFGASKKTGEVYGTFTTVTAPTTFTTAVGPIASLY